VVEVAEDDPVAGVDESHEGTRLARARLALKERAEEGH
jgi:hypothetical protein